MNETIAGFAGKPYAEVAVEVIKPFVGGAIADADLARMAREAYGTFRHPAIAPLVATRCRACSCSSCFTGRRSPSRTSPCSWWRG